MSNESSTNTPKFIRLALTNDQKAQVHQSTGVEAEAIELSARELEERIAPRMNPLLRTPND